MQAVPGDVAANLAAHRTGRRAKQRQGGAALLITPELALTGYGAGDAIRRWPSRPTAQMAQRLRDLRRGNGIAIIAGFAERDGETCLQQRRLSTMATGTRRLPQIASLRRL